MAQAAASGFSSPVVVLGFGLGFGAGLGLGFRLGIGVSVVIPVLGIVGVVGREQRRGKIISIVVVGLRFGTGLRLGFGLSLGLWNGDVLGEEDLTKVDLEGTAPDGQPLEVGGLQILGKGESDLFLQKKAR